VLKAEGPLASGLLFDTRVPLVEGTRTEENLPTRQGRVPLLGTRRQKEETEAVSRGGGGRGLEGSVVQRRGQNPCQPSGERPGAQGRGCGRCVTGRETEEGRGLG
jgi:hypothetical protein